MERKAHQFQMQDNPLNYFVCKTEDERLAPVVHTATSLTEQAKKRIIQPETRNAIATGR